MKMLDRTWGNHLIDGDEVDVKQNMPIGRRTMPTTSRCETANKEANIVIVHRFSQVNSDVEGSNRDERMLVGY